MSFLSDYIVRNYLRQTPSGSRLYLDLVRDVERNGAGVRYGFKEIERVIDLRREESLNSQ